MSTATRINEPPEPFPVFSRISWGAILGGTAVTFSVYVLLNLLGAAIGLSIEEPMEEFATGAAIWAIVSFMVAIFLGGWVASRFTLGEDTLEALLYGAILWGVSFMLTMWMFGAGFGALVGMSTSPMPVLFTNAQLQELGGEAGLNAQQITNLQAAANRGEKAPDQESLAQAAWWAFGGTLLTMISAIGGTWLGASSYSRRVLLGDRFVYTQRTVTGVR